ncbi:MAG: hypothetical protein EBV05_01965 [Cyanobacteria bacterium WB6_1B_304]|nr:hypothetical protein [Cyanobacteria bacterium WB6_1B_304]
MLINEATKATRWCCNCVPVIAIQARAWGVYCGGCFGARAESGVQIALKAGSGFSLPEIIRVCEQAAVSNALGYSCNAVLKGKIQLLLEQVMACLNETGKTRLFDGVYYATKLVITPGPS